MKTPIRCLVILWLALAAFFCARAPAVDAPSVSIKTERFDRDPGWEGYNNRIVPKNALMVKQDFGYSATHFAGAAAGEIGGRIQRSTTPASYAAKIAPKTLDDNLSASGSFAITASEGSAGVFFGLFNSQQPGGSGRPIGSLGLDFDFESSGGRLAVRLITGGNKSCGTFITPYLPGKFRPTPIKNDGTRYHWTLDYDPQSAGGAGRFTFTMRSETHTRQDYGALPDDSGQEAQARFPNTTTFTVDLTPGFRKEGATFDRFGVLNMMKSGGTATMFFDDVRCDGEAQDFSADPGWLGAGNRVTFEDRKVVGAHDFGFSEKTNHAGGAPGEVGGGLWRGGDFGYYADRVGPLDLEQRLEARGKVMLVTAGPDSDMHLGWFSAVGKDKSPVDAGNFVGIHVGGPTRIGHYFLPRLTTAKGTIGKVDQGPVLTPGKVFEWSLVYDPAASDGEGELRATLGAESVTLALKPGQKAEGARLDHFGLLTSTDGGQMVKIYLDDLQYSAAAPKELRELRVGIAGHAFDHLGGIGDQAEAAVASGANIIYPGGLGALSYEGLPKAEGLEIARAKASDYLRHAKAGGVKLAIAYVCSTSIVKLATFDQNWSKELCAQFATPPAQWLQQDREGRPLPSWYGGDYLPACKNNPDWRTYEKFMVKLQLTLGNDGIFFDNPTVHPQGCYCEHCLKKFAGFLANEGTTIELPANDRTLFLRQLATTRARDFLRFRATIARDFLTEMRSYARTIKPDALVTCNNSLNTSDALFSQSRTLGYNIYEMSKAEDFVVVEDMATQPRVLPDGSVAEYGPTYEMLHAISHGKPVVACTLAEGDYHTAPNLVRLAMAEAAAHRASYLAWPTWPENVRQRMASTIRPQADFLRENASLLNETTPAAEALLFLPFRRWVDTADCQPQKIASALSRANVQFEVVCEDDLAARLHAKPRTVLLAESQSVFLPSENATLDQFKRDGGKVVWTAGDNWLTEYQSVAGKPAVAVQAPATIRAVVCDQPRKRIVHLLNLNVQRLSSFEDTVNPAADVRLQIRVPFAPQSVKAISADPDATHGPVKFTVVREGNEDSLDVTIPSLVISTILVIE